MLPGLTGDEQRDLIVSVGTHRGERRLAPVEVAELFAKARNAEASVEDCAQAVGFTNTTMVSRFLRLLDLDKRVSYLVGWGASGSTIAFTAASEIARLRENAEQVEAFEAALANGLTTAEVKQAVQARLRSGKSIRQAVDETVRLRPQIERRHVFVGDVVSSEVQLRLRELHQSERDLLLRRAVGEVVEANISVSGRLAPDRFTLTGSDDLAAVLSRLDDFEARINEGLERALDSE